MVGSTRSTKYGDGATNAADNNNSTPDISKTTLKAKNGNGVANTAANNNNVNPGTSKAVDKGKKRAAANEEQSPSVASTKRPKQDAATGSISAPALGERPLPSSSSVPPESGLPTPQKSTPAKDGQGDLKYQTVPNFLVPKGQPFAIGGMSVAVDIFEQFVLEGHKRVEFITEPDQMLIQALNGSLRWIHREDGEDLDLASFLKHSKQANRMAFDALGGDPVAEASLLLEKLGPLMGVTYQLGYTTWIPAYEGCEVVLVPVSKPANSTEVVWIHNDQMDTTKSSMQWSAYSAVETKPCDVDEKGTAANPLQVSSDSSPLSSPEPGWDSAAKDIESKTRNTAEAIDEMDIDSDTQDNAEGIPKVDDKDDEDDDETANRDYVTAPEDHDDDDRFVGEPRHKDNNMSATAGPATESRSRPTCTGRKGKMPYTVIVNAPPEDASLPFRHMQGITSEEMLVFFPNHAVHQHAMAARLVEDGWTYKGIAAYLNLVYPNQVDEVLANTIAVAMKHALEWWYEDPSWTMLGFMPQFRQRREARRANPSVYNKEDGEKIVKLESKKWLSPRGDAIHNHWSLRKVGWFLWHRGHGFPCKGQFTDKVTLAMNGETVERGLYRNPPRLPEDYVPGMAELPEIARPKEREPSELQKQKNAKKPAPPPKDAHLKTHLKRKANRDRDKVLEEAVADPEGFVAQHQDLVADETLLWLLMKSGGNLSIAKMMAILQKDADARNKNITDASERVQPINRSTISKRREAALQRRANKNKTDYKVEHDAFQALESHERAKKKRLMSPVTPPGQFPRGDTPSDDEVGVSGQQPRPRKGPRKTRTLLQTGITANSNSTGGVDPSQLHTGPMPGYLPAEPLAHGGSQLLDPAMNTFPPADYAPAAGDVPNYHGNYFPADNDIAVSDNFPVSNNFSNGHNQPAVANNGDAAYFDTGFPYGVNPSQAAAFDALRNFNSSAQPAQPTATSMPPGVIDPQLQDYVPADPVFTPAAPSTMTEHSQSAPQGQMSAQQPAFDFEQVIQQGFQDGLAEASLTGDQYRLADDQYDPDLAKAFDQYIATENEENANGESTQHHGGDRMDLDG